MKLLVTNDDGIHSLFLHELVSALQAAGHELFIVAPANEQSWTGAAKTRTRPVKSSVADQGFGCPTWTTDGTPSDCVNIAIAHLLPVAVDGVISGINVGFNCTIGFILASGTVSAALEGALHGFPAMAVSQDVPQETYDQLKVRGARPAPELHDSLRCSAQHAARLAGELLPGVPPRSFTVHNINFPFPCRADTPVKRAIPARLLAPGLYSPADVHGDHRLLWHIGEDLSPAGELTDVACLNSGCISHTVLDYRTLGR
ncbi:MAG TPA: 5'/3'-nucleotidase SurE [Lacunisphaera sp.]|jgi:5'-nucleotidase|nr:5'/3'-nucleotidase SurE [Lacunisphaera sp.]